MGMESPKGAPCLSGASSGLYRTAQCNPGSTPCTHSATADRNLNAHTHHSHKFKIHKARKKKSKDVACRMRAKEKAAWCIY